MTAARIGSMISVEWSLSQSVRLKLSIPCVRTESGTGFPRKMSGMTTRYPARARSSARLSVISLMSKIEDEGIYSLLLLSSRPNASGI